MAPLAIDPADADESPAKVRQQPIIERKAMNESIPLKGIVTSDRQTSSSESKDEECRLGIEDDESIWGVAPVSESGAETGG